MFFLFLDSTLFRLDSTFWLNSTPKLHYFWMLQLVFLQAGCLFCRPTYRAKTLKENLVSE